MGEQYIFSFILSYFSAVLLTTKKTKYPQIRASFGVFVPLPVNISFARDKALAWVLNVII